MAIGAIPSGLTSAPGTVYPADSPVLYRRGFDTVARCATAYVLPERVHGLLVNFLVLSPRIDADAHHLVDAVRFLRIDYRVDYAGDDGRVLGIAGRLQGKILPSRLRKAAGCGLACSTRYSVSEPLPASAAASRMASLSRVVFLLVVPWRPPRFG